MIDLVSTENLTRGESVSALLLREKRFIHPSIVDVTRLAIYGASLLYLYIDVCFMNRLTESCSERRPFSPVDVYNDPVTSVECVCTMYEYMYIYTRNLQFLVFESSLRTTGHQCVYNPCRSGASGRTELIINIIRARCARAIQRWLSTSRFFASRRIFSKPARVGTSSN